VHDPIAGKPDKNRLFEVLSDIKSLNPKSVFFGQLSIIPATVTSNESP
jgi:hypothetical protein